MEGKVVMGYANTRVFVVEWEDKECSSRLTLVRAATRARAEKMWLSSHENLMGEGSGWSLECVTDMPHMRELV